jgi:adenylate cyclase
MQKRSWWSAVVVGIAAALLGWGFAHTHLDVLSNRQMLAVIFGALASVALMRVPLIAALFSGLSFIAGAIIISRALGPKEPIRFGWIILFVEIGFALVCAIVANTVRARGEKKALATALSAYFPEATANRYTELRYRKLFEPGTERRDLTILFAEMIDPTAREELLRACIHSSAGALVKTGEGRPFGIWNAPESQRDHATRACKAALRLCHRAPFRVGIHTGVAAVGNLGDAGQVNYSAMGNSVEMAAHIAALNKLLGTRVLITSETRRWMSDNFVTRYMGNFRFKNSDEAFGVYELMGADEVDDMNRALRDAFEQAVYAFQGSDQVDAESSFRRVLEVYPDDRPSKFYLSRIEAMSGEPWPYDWSGTVEISEISTSG